MQRRDSTEDKVSPEWSRKSNLLAALKLCGRSRDLRTGKNLHLQASKHGLLSDVCIGNSFVTMYAKCGSMFDAQLVFESLKERKTVVSWNALLHGYADNGDNVRVLQLFEQMQVEAGDGRAPRPNNRSYVAALTACAALGNRGAAESWLEKGRVFHSEAENTGHCDLFVESALVSMYSKCGSVLNARRVFDRMVRKDVVSWSCLIQGYVENGDCERALELFEDMVARSCQGGCAPNARTYVSALVACGTLGTKWLDKGRKIYSHCAKNRCCDIFVETAAIDMYSKCRCLENAKSLFNSMVCRNVVTWNSLIQGCMNNGESEEALNFFYTMVESSDCVPDARTYVAVLNACACLAVKHPNRNREWLAKGKALHSQVMRSLSINTFVENALLNMYEKCRSMTDACILFDGLAPSHDLFAWSCLIRGYVDKGDPRRGLELFAEMVDSGASPNSATFVAALMACGSLMASNCGTAVHGAVNRCGLERDLMVATCLMEFYARCGRMPDAKQVFDSISEKDARAWNALILAYSEQGETEKALQLVERMVEQGVVPDKVTFIHILCACSHSGLTVKGKECFERMQAEHGVRPEIEHYACMVDLLGRGNQVEEAFRLIRLMPYEADSVIWHSLLNSCKKWRNVALAEEAYQALLRLNKNDACMYVSMAQTH